MGVSGAALGQGILFYPPYATAGKRHKEQYTQGVRGIMHYQGPVNNPGTEVNIACGGLIASDPSQDIKQVLSQVIGQLYQPRHPEVYQKHVRIFIETEQAYFD